MSDERAVQEILARYVRAVDARNADDVADLYTANGAEILSYNRAGTPEPIAAFTGSTAIRDAVANVLPPHPELGWAHHATFDPIVAVNEDTAALQAQFIVFDVRGRERPSDGWPKGASGGQGTITPIEAGYYRIALRRTDDGWKITENHTILDLPPALPET
jgi:ketosteroid isomerase-like protein